jgi:hypothetical protein
LKKRKVYKEAISFYLRAFRIPCKVEIILYFNPQNFYDSIFVFFQPGTDAEMYKQKSPSGYIGEVWHLLEEEMNFT